MTKQIAIHWFRQDLRLSDNPALYEASAYDSVLPIYILDDDNAGDYAMGGASRWWLHQSLASLNASLGGRLSIYSGNPMDILEDIISRFNVKAVFWNRCYEPWRMHRDALIKKQLTTKDIEANSLNGSLLWEPWTIKKGDGTPYKVFTPFYRKGCLGSVPPRKPLPAPEKTHYLKDKQGCVELGTLKLLPDIHWSKTGDLSAFTDLTQQSTLHWNKTLDSILKISQQKKQNPASEIIALIEQSKF